MRRLFKKEENLMEYFTTDGLTKKENGKKAGTRGFIREQLDLIPKGEGARMKDLAEEIVTARPNVRGNGSAYIRISGVLKKGSYKKDFEKRTGVDGFTYITRLSDSEKEAIEFGL